MTTSQSSRVLVRLPGPPPGPPPTVNVDQGLVNLPKDQVIRRKGVGTSGRRISLLSNHFHVTVKRLDEVFYQYHVSICFEDKKIVENKEINRKVIDQLYKTYSKELSGKRLAYDGEKCLYTLGPLPRNKLEFSVVVEESSVKRGSMSDHGRLEGLSSKRAKQSFRSKSFIVEISYSAKVPLESISLALQGSNAPNHQDALRVLDIILRQQAANRGCLLVRQSFFRDDSRNFVDIGGGVVGCRGFHSSFCSTQGGLSLNMDVSTTMIVAPGPVIDFLLKNQSIRDVHHIDWGKAKKVLKLMGVKAQHNNIRYKIQGFSPMPCNQQFFPLKLAVDEEPFSITVYDYFTKHLKIPINHSAYMPCLDVGKANRPVYLPLELCSLVSLQRYKKVLTATQRSSLVEKSRQKPQERMRVITNANKENRYDEDPFMEACGITIDKRLTELDGRVLEAPKLKIGNNQDCVPNNGRWNFNNKQLLEPIAIKKWAVVNFSSRWDLSHISRELINCARNKGVLMERPCALINEDHHSRSLSPAIRVERMFEQFRCKITDLQCILCVLPDRKTYDVYGPWKRKCLCDYGIPNQCISPIKVNDQYFSNVLLKINTKLGGINSLLAIEKAYRIPVVNDTPTMILGMDVSHGSPGLSDVPSIAAVVGSLSWPLISRYRAAVRTQSSKLEIIDSLYKPVEDGGDRGIMRELLLDYYQSSKQRKPTQIIVFRDGVGESQFSEVLKKELDQMIKAFRALGDGDLPKFTFIVAQKNHHTKIFQANGNDINVPPGTVVDTKIVHPRNYDFFMCAHAGMIGTSRPVHYNVLLDDICFEPDDLQNLIHALSYTNQRSTQAISIVAPIFYAHLAAAQMSQFIKFDESVSSNDMSKSGTSPIPELPRLHEKVARSMFFC